MGVPDLILEILPPSTLKKDIDNKCHLYDESGVKEDWFIAPEYKQVSICILNDRVAYYLMDDFSHDSKIGSSCMARCMYFWLGCI